MWDIVKVFLIWLVIFTVAGAFAFLLAIPAFWLVNAWFEPGPLNATISMVAMLLLVFAGLSLLALLAQITAPLTGYNWRG